MRILIADDHPLYREAVRLQVERLYPQAQVDETASLDDAELLAEQNGDYDLFLFDFNMPGMSHNAIMQHVQKYPNIPVAIISGTAKNDDVRAVIRAGARGFVPKTSSGENLANILRLLLAGGTSVPAEALNAASDGGEADAADTPPWLSQLTPRELEVLRGTARGLANKEIARELKLAEVTVKLHLRSIFRKIGARGRASAAVIATKAGIG
jgi:DNA-binding NarL/FixJ family response regulator